MILKTGAHPTPALFEQAVLRTAPGPVTRWLPCWKATSASATINTSPMGTSGTPCPLSGWLSATVRRRHLLFRRRELVDTNQSPIFLSRGSAGEQQNVLAVANEEGIVRLYNTESRENPLLKGTCMELIPPPATNFSLKNVSG